MLAVGVAGVNLKVHETSDRGVWVNDLEKIFVTKEEEVVAMARLEMRRAMSCANVTCGVLLAKAIDARKLDMAMAVGRLGTNGYSCGIAGTIVIAVHRQQQCEVRSACFVGCRFDGALIGDWVILPCSGVGWID